MSALRVRPPGPLKPGAAIGIIGGGQLGRMTALAAARLGYRCHIYCPETGAPAVQVAAAATFADYDDLEALAAFAAEVDVITFEFENIPARSIEALEAMAPVRPGARVLATGQDRVAEKSFFNANNIPTAPWRKVDGPDCLARAVQEIGAPAVLKTARLGYDGKGQVRIDAQTDLDEAWWRMGAEIGILEGFITFESEVSVITARGVDGLMRSYVPVANRHTNHILDTTTAPAPLAPALAQKAIQMAETTAAQLDLVGLLAVEMFVTKDGELLANEMAPRPHNSGHWTIDACLTDQFEQFVRAVCGLPLGSPERHSDAVMKNLIGGDIDGWDGYLTETGVKLHHYGKTESRPGRKMGHLTRIYPKGSLPTG